jgi:uridylate kinase
VLLKLSGEAFADSSIGSGIDAVVVKRLAEEVAEAVEALNVEIALVVGGGNIHRVLTGEQIGTLVD